MLWKWISDIVSVLLLLAVFFFFFFFCRYTRNQTSTQKSNVCHWEAEASSWEMCKLNTGHWQNKVEEWNVTHASIQWPSLLCRQWVARVNLWWKCPPPFPHHTVGSCLSAGCYWCLDPTQQNGVSYKLTSSQTIKPCHKISIMTFRTFCKILEVTKIYLSYWRSFSYKLACHQWQSPTYEDKYFHREFYWPKVSVRIKCKRRRREIEMQR